jgi:hypothetical protein
VVDERLLRQPEAVSHEKQKPQQQFEKNQEQERIQEQEPRTKPAWACGHDRERQR